MSRRSINTTIDNDLYTIIQSLALKISARDNKKTNANDLIEEGMRLVKEKYKDLLP
jgi:hypothetical protein